MENSKPPVPVYLLTGFLGSGKTTLLKRMLDYWQTEGKKAAVIMNELGDINLDGQEVGDEVPMAELLGGCICCTIRGDLSLEMKLLMDEHQPDIIVIESTGAANPMEILDGVTEAAMYMRIDLRAVITVVDGPELLKRTRAGKGRTLKLMQDQIRCASFLLLNKVDKLDPEQLVEAQQALRELNAHAQIVATMRCIIDEWSWLDTQQAAAASSSASLPPANQEHVESAHACGPGCSHKHDEAHIHHHHSQEQEELHAHHHSHDHVMALTHYLQGPVDSVQFEALLNHLPEHVYRAKGIVTFTDTASRFLFQYAYGESDFMKITPQGKVNDVAVFIGEHFSREELIAELSQLENGASSGAQSNPASQ
ncbi:GTP-binding protein [Paenibacillus sp. KS-LC4]|uniref:CobW family GTP-binding protein n=1 Tax=Paenibacillus sp. KS-LC4 TaxID=2979727 RepID=UPI0030CBC4CF